MPVSGDEESGVIVRQFSSCPAGVPIKKRRFLLVRSPSPPPQEPSSLDVANGSKKTRHLIQRPLLLNANSAVNTFGGSDSRCISFSEEKKENVAEANVALTGINISEGKAQEPSNTIQSGTIDNVETKEMHVLTDKTASIMEQGSSELDLAPKETLVNMKVEMHNKQVEENYNIEVSKSTETAVSSLGCKEPLATALEHQDNEASSQVANYLEDSSPLSLSLIQGKSVIQGKSADHMVNSDNAPVCTDRSNWDLNTTMDAWERSLHDASLQGKANFGRSDETSGSTVSQISTSLSGQLGFGMGENRSTSSSPHLHLRQHHKSEDSLHLSLGMSLHQSNFSKEQSGLLARLDSDGVVRSLDYRGVLSSNAKINTTGHRIVKSEPVDDKTKCDFVGARCSPMGLSDARNVKQEVVEKSVQESVKSFNDSSQKSVEHRSMKSEPVQEFHQKVHRAFEITSNHSVGPVTQSQDNCSYISVMSVTPTKTSSSGLLTNLELSVSGNVSNQSEHSDYSNQHHVNKHTPAVGNVEKSTAQTIPIDVCNENKELNASICMTNSCTASDFDNSNDETCKSQLTDEVPLNLHANCDGSPSDEEMVNTSTDMMEDTYGSDYESDSNHDVPTAMDKEDRQCNKEDDEYEDGEVREPLMHPAVDGLVGNLREEENIIVDERDARNLISSCFLGEGEPSCSQAADEKDKRTKDHGETSDDHVKVCVDTVYVEKNNQGVEKILSSEEPLSVEMVASEADEKRVIKAAQRELPYQLGGKYVQLAHEKEILSDGSHGTVTTVNQTSDGNVKGTELVDKAESVIPKAEASATGEDAAKDANSSGSRSRIISLPRASNAKSPYRNRPIRGRSFTSRTGRERYTDYEQERLYLRGTRDEIYSDVPQKFVRERIHDQSFRNNRKIFIRGRGRGSSRLDALRDEWDGGQDFGTEMCNGPVNYRFPRNKRASDVTDSDLEYNDYIMDQDECAVTASKGGRNNLNEDLPSFHHLSSRRLSPRSRDGPATRGFQIVRRIPRNISPSGSTGADGSVLVGLRRGEKFMSGLPDDGMDPMFSRAQNFERLDGQFVRGNRNFSSLQRRGDPRIQSKSPVRSRTRSPGPWLATQRSPDGFCGLPELTQHRSPVINRMGRRRSLDRPCFPGERVPGRRRSPLYIGHQSNDFRNIGTGGDHSHPRSAIHKRGSPSEQILFRNTRRFDVLDPRERTGTDEYFGRPIRSGSFHELHADDSIDERRNCGEGRGVVRPLRPPFRGTDGQNIRFHVDDGPKPVRFYSEADSEFTERSNLRGRDFDRQIKNRPIVAHRRLRGIGEQEGNYRHSGQAWHDDGLDDLSRGKKRKF